jgi:hypothetical protein
MPPGHDRSSACTWFEALEAFDVVAEADFRTLEVGDDELEPRVLVLGLAAKHKFE